MDGVVGKARAAKCAAVFLLALAVSGSLTPLSGETAEAQASSGADVNFIWAEQFGTSAADGARSVAVDPSDGSPIVAGYTAGAIDPEGNPPDTTVPTDPSQTPQINVNRGGEDVYVRKHSRDGEWEWTRQFGSSLGDTTTWPWTARVTPTSRATEILLDADVRVRS